MNKYRIIIGILVAIMCFNAISQTENDSPYSIFGEQTPVRDVEYGHSPVLWKGYVICKDSLIAEIQVQNNRIIVMDLEGNILSKSTITPTSKAMFTSMDPKAAEMRWTSPYTYCFANPIFFTDPTGRNPIYSTTGKFLGTDDYGLQGDYIVMNEDDFHQNMLADEVEKFAIDRSSITNEAIALIEKHYKTLPDRPDYDGYLTLGEANEWYRNGNGQNLYVNLSKIDLSGITSLEDKIAGENFAFNLLNGASNNINDGLVYGNITFVIKHNTLRAYADEYDFNMHSWSNPRNWPRNLEAMIGARVAGKGKPYLIIFCGPAQINAKIPCAK